MRSRELRVGVAEGAPSETLLGAYSVEFFFKEMQVTFV